MTARIRLDREDTTMLRTDVPVWRASCPVAWRSVTVYDIATRYLIKNKDQIADRSSRQDLVKNADGCVGLYFGPSAPTGFETNWIPTVSGKAWFAYFRLDGPLEAYFDKSWSLPISRR